MNRTEYWQAVKDATSAAVDHVKSYPKSYAIAAGFLLAFAFGIYVARADVVVKGCSLPTWDAATNTVTCAQSTPGPIEPPIPPNPIPVGRFAGCPSDALTIDRQWGKDAIPTRDFGTFSQNILSIRIDVPANFSGVNVRQSNWAQYGSSPIIREGVLSRKACSFDPADAVKNRLGQPMSNIGLNQQGFVAKYSSAPSTTTVAQFKPGEVYFINIRNKDSWGNFTCSAGQDCDMRGGLPQ